MDDTVATGLLPQKPVLRKEDYYRDRTFMTSNRKTSFVPNLVAPGLSVAPISEPDHDGHNECVTSNPKGALVPIPKPNHQDGKPEFHNLGEKMRVTIILEWKISKTHCNCDRELNEYRDCCDDKNVERHPEKVKQLRHGTFSPVAFRIIHLSIH